MNNITSVFVYGTLKEGQPNYRVACRAGQHTVTPALLIGHRLYDLGPYPAVVAGPGYVVGELLDYGEGIGRALEPLDRLEGFYGHGDPHNHYNRTSAEVTLQTGDRDAEPETVRCWIYLYNRSLQGVPRLSLGHWPEQQTAKLVL